MCTFPGHRFAYSGMNFGFVIFYFSYFFIIYLFIYLFNFFLGGGITLLSCFLLNGARNFQRGTCECLCKDALQGMWDIMKRKLLQFDLSLQTVYSRHATYLKQKVMYLYYQVTYLGSRTGSLYSDPSTDTL